VNNHFLAPATTGPRFVMACAMVVLAALLAGVSASGGEPERCAKCGMHIVKYPHTRYTVYTTDGKQHITCGVQCGLSLHVRLKDAWKSATATDLFSNRSFDAKTGFYVFKSSVITDMAPGFISFRSREHAEKFAQGFGGRVVTYDEALELWKKQMD